MRTSAFCEARAWPLVTSNSIQDLAATSGIGTPWARAGAGASTTAAPTMAAVTRADVLADAKSGVALFNMFQFPTKKKGRGVLPVTWRGGGAPPALGPRRDDPPADHVRRCNEAVGGAG